MEDLKNLETFHEEDFQENQFTKKVFSRCVISKEQAEILKKYIDANQSFGNVTKEPGLVKTVEGFKKYINEFGFISPEEIREIVSKEHINSPKLVDHFGTVSHTYQKKDILEACLLMKHSSISKVEIVKDFVLKNKDHDAIVDKIFELKDFYNNGYSNNRDELPRKLFDESKGAEAKKANQMVAFLSFVLSLKLTHLKKYPQGLSFYTKFAQANNRMITQERERIIHEENDRKRNEMAALEAKNTPKQPTNANTVDELVLKKIKRAAKEGFDSLSTVYGLFSDQSMLQEVKNYVKILFFSKKSTGTNPERIFYKLGIL
ncbi:hypothetical protein [Holospora undulata]|uniref:Uncharacterized protein n=1 Tax=Holospora undulata HU1 TaxID=1321371 RepID=A0A061JIB8_9PROT|nr:hypothetical protein [Holospora undulata]ETZ05382.1 hypothetical protein K737_300181 [Holospora undulata HU1]